MVVIPQVHAETEPNCVKFKAEHLITVESIWGHECEWVVNKYLSQGWKLNGYQLIDPVPEGGMGYTTYESWILTK